MDLHYFPAFFLRIQTKQRDEVCEIFERIMLMRFFCVCVIWVCLRGAWCVRGRRSRREKNSPKENVSNIPNSGVSQKDTTEDPPD